MYLESVYSLEYPDSHNEPDDRDYRCRRHRAPTDARPLLSSPAGRTFTPAQPTPAGRHRAEGRRSTRLDAKPGRRPPRAAEVPGVKEETIALEAKVSAPGRNGPIRVEDPALTEVGPGE